MKYFEKMTCVKCDYKSIWGSKILLHLIFKHHIKPTKKDWKFAWNHGAENRLLWFPVGIIICAVYLISHPFWWIHEAIDRKW